MKLLCLTICCFMLSVRSQYTFEQASYPNYYVNPLTINREQIYFEDQLVGNSKNSDLSVRQVTPLDSQTAKKTSEIQPTLQQQSTSSVSSPNPANFNLWNKEPVNSGQSTVNQNTINTNQALGNQNQFLTNQNQVFDNQNQAAINQNQAASVFNPAAPLDPNQGAPNFSFNQNPSNSQNENVPIGNLDLSVLDGNFSPKIDNNENTQTQDPPISQQVQNIFGDTPTVGTLNLATPKIDNIGLSVTSFGLNLVRALSDQYGGNIVISPFSISTCLALLQQGAYGTTQSQITNALRLRPEASRAVYKAIAEDITKRSSPNILRSANNIFMAKNFDFNANFSDIAQNDFGSTISGLDYSQPIQAAKDINNWVAAQTNQKIKQIVRPSDVGIATQMTLVNALYFKGLWDIGFNEAKTKPREFHLSNGQNKTVPFMRTRRSLRGGMEPATKAKVMTVPFKNEEYSLMWILPPPEMNIDDYIKSLTAEQIREFREFPLQECDFEVPRFTLTSNTNLVLPLRKMGLTDMFGPFADLSGIGGNRYHTFPLQVSSAVHTAKLSVTEQGASASAATSIGVVALSYDIPFKFKANVPSLVILWDSASAVPLFMVKLMEPIEE